MAKETITSGAGVLWSTIVTMLNNMFTEVYSRLFPVQVAELTPIQLAEFIPKTVGKPTFEVGGNSSANGGAGTGTYNQGVWFGFNSGQHSGLPATTGKPALIMGFEDNFFSNGGDEKYGAEWYIEGWSPDGTTVPMSRPFYCRGLQGDDGSDWWTIMNNIGSSGTYRYYTIKAGPTDLFSVYPDQIVIGVPIGRTSFSDLIANDNSSTVSILRQQDGNNTIGKGINVSITPFPDSWGDGETLYGVYSTADKGTGHGALSVLVGGYFSATGGAKNYGLIVENGSVGIGTTAPTSPLHVVGIPVYANNAAAIAGGLTVGAFYRTGADPDPLMIVH